MNSQPKIVFAIDGTFIGGGHRIVILLAIRVREEGKTTPLILVSGEGPFTEELARQRLAWKVVPMGKRLSLGKFLTWKKVLKELPMDILHLHGGVAGFWGRWAASIHRSYKIILTIHGIHYLHHSNKLVAWLSLWMDQRFKNKSDMTIFVSKADSSTAFENKIADPSKSTVIYNGIETAKFTPPTQRFPGEKGQAALIQVGVVGRLTRMKGQRYALEALSILRDRFPQMRLTFYGAGEDLKLLTDMTAHLKLRDRVTFSGFQNDIVQAYRQLNINLMPSLWEGQPLTLLESLAAGVPTIASNLDCVNEIVTDGKECLLVPSANAAALVRAIERVLEDEPLRRSLIENGLSFAPGFDVSHMFDHTMGLYQRMLSSS